MKTFKNSGSTNNLKGPHSSGEVILGSWYDKLLPSLTFWSYSKP
jgi:hypothetical protein